MIDPTTRAVLQESVRRESRSLLQYAREIPLWVGPADRPALAKLKALAVAEQSATDDLGKYLQRQKAGLVILGPYPSGFTTVNDSALHYVLPLLVREHLAAVKALEADLALVSDPDAKMHLAELVRLKRQHAIELESLTSGPHTKQ